jgi:hypothetical protein
LEHNKGMKTVIEAFKEKMADKIENERDERRKEILIKALQRGTELLEGKS